MKLLGKKGIAYQRRVMKVYSAKFRHQYLCGYVREILPACHLKTFWSLKWIMIEYWQNICYSLFADLYGMTVFYRHTHTHTVRALI